MDRHTPVTVGYLTQTMWAAVIGLLPGLAIFGWLTRRDHRRLLREMEERHREWSRLREIEDQLWLESLPEDRRAKILESRRQQEEQHRRAQEMLAHEHASLRVGRDHGRADGRPDA
jgi:hypothetical protein